MYLATTRTGREEELQVDETELRQSSASAPVPFVGTSPSMTVRYLDPDVKIKDIFYPQPTSYSSQVSGSLRLLIFPTFPIQGTQP